MREYKKLIAESRITAIVDKKYGTKPGDGNRIFGDPYYRFARILDHPVLRNLQLNANDQWLDLGCHHGQFIEMAASQHECRFVGIDDWDLKRDMPFTGFSYFQSDLASMTWPEQLNGKMQVVSALEVIEHMIDTEQFLKQIYGLLDSRGLLVLSTPNINSLRNRVLVPFGKYPAYLEYRNRIHHVRLFNPTVLRSLLSECGFECLSVIGVNLIPARLLHWKLFRKISEWLANALPSLCGNIIVIARKAN